MDVDACAGGDGTRRKTDSRAEGAVEVVPLELYDSARAKIDADLRWLFAKAYGIEHIPEDLRDPFYTDQYEQEHIKPPVIRLLLSGELYCRVCALILKGDQVASLQSHQSVVQALSRKGIYVMESDDSPVSESDLGCTPIKMSAHMAMIDALMMAYTVEMISIEKVVASVKRFSTFSASKELPFDLEDAMVFWINKVNLKMREITEKELKLKQHLLESPSHQKVRYRRDHLSGRQLPYFPLLEDLMKDVCDCGALLAVVHYYCPDHMKLDDVCLKEVTSIADSLYNIQLLKEFANEYLNKGFYLTIEDMLYAPLVLKVPSPSSTTQTILHERSSQDPGGTRHPVPISNATKRSFLVSPGAPDTVQHTDASCRYYQHPEESQSVNKGSPALGASHPLLPLRQRQQKSLQGEAASDQRNRSNSLTRVDGHPRGSVMAWAEKKQRPLSQPTPFATDSDADLASGDSVSLARSISKDSLASNAINVTPSHQLGGPVFHLGPRGISGHSMLGHVNVRDDEEEEELVAIIKSEKGLDAGCVPSQENLDIQNVSSRRRPQEIPIEPQPDSFYLEPLMPAVLKPAKEKSINLNKEEECGEVRSRSSSRRGTEGPTPSTRRKVHSSGSNHDLNHTFTPISSTEFLPEPMELPTEGGSGAFKPDVTSNMDPSSRGQSCGFFLHASDKGDSTPLAGQVRTSPFSNSLAWEISKDSESEEEEQDTELFLAREKCLDREGGEAEEEESLKLQEDMNVREHEDKDGASGRSSPCLSTISQASSIGSSSARMTSFAERRQMKAGGHDARSSTSSSQKTTPDGSESFQLPLTTWRQKREQSPTLQGRDGANLLASELVQLHMQLEEKRRAIETQKKKMESLSARQRLKLGKAAFLNIVKKGKSDTLPQPLKSDHYSKEDQKVNGEKEVSSKDDSCVEALRGKARERNGQEGKAKVRWAMEPPTSPGSLEMDNKINSALLLDNGSTEPDLNECNRSIEMLNEAISAIQHQMMQLSLQQDLLMKQNVQSPPGSSVAEPKIRPAVHFVEPISSSGSTVVRKPPKLSSGRGPRSKPTELKLPKESGKQAMRVITPTQNVETLPHLRQFSGGRTPKGESEGSSSASTAPVEAAASLERGIIRNMTFRLNDEANQRTAIPREPSNIEECLSGSLKERDLNPSDGSGKENVLSEDVSKNKTHLIEVDLSDLKDPTEDTVSDIRDVTADLSDGDQKSVLGFFFKDEQKAEDEMAKKRAAFLLKQQRKAEEARIRKQQLELESELKRDEARRKAEEDRIRKEEEKARRELIKQEYLRRKQQEMIEEQGLAKPKSRPKKQRPKSVHRGESSSDTYSKCSSTPDNLSSAQSGSSLSLASAATTEAESVNSGGGGSQQWCFCLELYIINGSFSLYVRVDIFTAVSFSFAGISCPVGPKLFKEPSAKSNKPIIHNAIAHLKSSVIYRKQFTVIPAKTVSVSVDALTIHNHLWQVKRPASSKRSVK
uniref:Calmodulin regulated spectrin-associated protein 1a n=1 Tax=Paramormyrops kingsleyae TaxID=1676925 RepID=A0A3B3RPP4_9TELE